MDALSALKMVGGPQMGAQLNGVMDQANSATKTIPMQDLQKLTSVSAPTADAPIDLSRVQSGSGDSFSNLLTNFVGEVNAKQTAAGDAVSGLLSGKNVSLHQAMISMEEASVSFQMMVEVRNKLLDSYQELMRMQV